MGKYKTEIYEEEVKPSGVFRWQTKENVSIKQVQRSKRTGDKMIIKISPDMPEVIRWKKNKTWDI